MKIYNTIEEVRADIKDHCLTIEGSVRFTFSFAIDASIIVEAWDIEAGDIKAGNIKAGNIEAWNIEAWDISFYAVCFAYLKFTCTSIAGRRKNSKYFCLDSDVVIKEAK